MIIREIAAAPDAIELALRVADRPGLAVLASDPRGAIAAEDARFAFVACDPVDASDAWVPDAGPPAGGWAGLGAAPRWIGAIPYEAGRALERPGWARAEARPAPSMLRPRWLRYDAVARIDRWSGRIAIEADGAAAAERLARALARPRTASMGPGPIDLRALPGAEPEDAHVARVRRVLELIARGDVYQVNLARSLSLRASGRPFDVFTALFKGAPSPYGFFVDFGELFLCGTSPELALEVRGDRLRTAPVKGTCPRGADAATDAALVRALDASPKERAELTMAIDLHRNDLGRVAAFGTVRVRGAPRVLGGRTVHSRVAEIVARRAPGVTLDAIARALVPCGSVTGAPKVRAMEIIADLEPSRRGLYTGAYGYVGRDGGLVLAMAIRTLEVEANGRARYGVGGGIVEGSDAWRELDETRWKAAQLERLVKSAPKVGRREEVGVPV